MKGCGSIMGFDNGILLAPMGPDVAGPELVAAVANAGGLGLLASPLNNYELTVKAIRETRMLTDKPFGAGVLLHFDNTESIRAIYDEKLACMQVYWGDFPKHMVNEAHEHGVKIMHQIGSLKDAEKAIAAGVDCIIVQGMEAGGHVIGQVSLMALLPRIVDLVKDKDIAVVAAGSIADARGYVAALSLGANGICMGTRFLASKESYVHDYYKQQILNYTEADTDLTDLYLRSIWRAPHRCLNTPFHQQWRDAPNSVQDNEDQPIIGHSIIHEQERALRRFTGYVANPTTRGELDKMVMYAGQGVGLVKEILPAGEIVRELVEGAEAIIKGLADKYLSKPRSSSAP